MATIFFDTFTEATDTALASHTPDIDVAGNGWVEANGTLGVLASTDKLRGTGTLPGDNDWIATVDVGEADVIITQKVSVGNTADDSGGVVFRFVDLSNYLLARIHFANQEFELYRRTSGSFHKIAGSAFSITAGVEYTIRVELDGDSIACTVDGGNDINTTHTQGQTATVHGIRIADTNVRVDDYKIETPGGGSILPQMMQMTG